MTDAQKALALELRAKGKTLREIGEKLGCSKEAVRRYLAKVKFQKYMDSLETVITASEIRLREQDILDGKSNTYNEAAKELNDKVIEPMLRPLIESLERIVNTR